MTCDRCEDIHKAQRDGKTSDECKCSCHTSITQPWGWELQPQWTIPFAIPCTGDPPWKQGETTCGPESDDTLQFRIERDDRDDPSTKSGKWVV